VRLGNIAVHTRLDYENAVADWRSSFIGKRAFVQDFSTKNAGGVVFSEPHGTSYADVGITDFVVGKRYFSHLETYLDPDPHGEPVLYWYKTVRNPKAPGGAEFVPELIDNHSGVGSDLLAIDLNNDGAMDIVTATRIRYVSSTGASRSIKN
jgi:hypothetical protein